MVVRPLSEPELPDGRGWRLEFNDEVHRVVIGTRDWQSFEVDRRQYQLPRLGYTKTRDFDLNGRPSSVTHSFKAEPVAHWIRRQSPGRTFVVASLGVLISSAVG